MTTRFVKYQNSIKKYSKDKINLFNNNFKEYVMNSLDSDELIPSITLLTIMNGLLQCTKEISLFSYDIAVGIGLIDIYNKALFDLRNDRMIKELPIIINLITCSNIDKIVGTSKSDDLTNDNEETPTMISMKYSKKAIKNIFVLKNVKEMMKLINHKFLSMNQNVIDYVPKYDTEKCIHTDIRKIHGTVQISEEVIKRTKQMHKQSLFEYIEKTKCDVCHLAMTLGWTLGCGNNKLVPKINKAAIDLGYMLYLAQCFGSVYRDLSELNRKVCSPEYDSQPFFSFNYIINFGLQSAFELYNEHKSKFWECLMAIDIKSPTINEYLEYLDKQIDGIIETTTPDLGSCIMPTVISDHNV